VHHDKKHEARPAGTITVRKSTLKLAAVAVLLLAAVYFSGLLTPRPEPLGNGTSEMFNACLDSGKYASEVQKDLDDGIAAGIQGTPGFVIGPVSGNGVVNGVTLFGAYPIANFRQAIDPLLAGGAAKGSVSASFDDDIVLGNKETAKIGIIEFSDFQCPFCRKWWRETMDSVLKEYVDSGEAVFVFRDFPLRSAHPAAQKSAEAAECAREQGKWLEFHDKIFAEQDEKGLGTIPYGVDDLKRWATKIGLE
jgi:protein-disulfide isomerase